ncbi:MAG: NAD(P)/FAD-dependent oxidoreductase [Myxococcota bacterium]|nr:NAD(P)/FAD-dependent oxidoreductase [Myxococcota bacterium]
MQCDVVIVGGSYAGLSAAMMLARGRRDVVILDTRTPRNRFASHSHGFFGQDGATPDSMLATGRDKVLAYPTVRLLRDAAVAARGGDNAFAIDTLEHGTLAARKVVLAYGVSDILPAIPGLAERWGKTVVHCPYCHGYELTGPQAVLAVSPMSAHQAMLITEWGPTTLFANGTDFDHEIVDELRRRNVVIERAPVTAIAGEATVHLADGRALPMSSLYVATQVKPNSSLGEQLGCAFDEGRFGGYLRTDGMRATTVPGVFAAGDITRDMHNATFATADGVMAGASAHRELVFGPHG